MFISDLDLRSLCFKVTVRKVSKYGDFTGPYFPHIRTEYGEILRISPYSVRMRQNTDQKNSVLGHISHSECFKLPSIILRS